MKFRSMTSQIPVAVLALVIVACSGISGTHEEKRANGRFHEPARATSR